LFNSKFGQLDWNVESIENINDADLPSSHVGSVPLTDNCKVSVYSSFGGEEDSHEDKGVTSGGSHSMRQSDSKTRVKIYSNSLEVKEMDNRTKDNPSHNSSTTNRDEVKSVTKWKISDDDQHHYTSHDKITNNHKSTAISNLPSAASAIDCEDKRISPNRYSGGNSPRQDTTTNNINNDNNNHNHNIAHYQTKSNKLLLKSFNRR